MSSQVVYNQCPDQCLPQSGGCPRMKEGERQAGQWAESQWGGLWDMLKLRCGVCSFFLNQGENQTETHEINTVPLLSQEECLCGRYLVCSFTRGREVAYHFLLALESTLEARNCQFNRQEAFKGCKCSLKMCDEVRGVYVPFSVSRNFFFFEWLIFHPFSQG